MESTVNFTQASAVKKGDVVLLKKRPCKILETTTSKTGKHGSAKTHLMGLDVVSGKKVEAIFKSQGTVEMPVVTLEDMDLIGVSNDGYLSLLTTKGTTTHDMKVTDRSVIELMQDSLRNGDPVVVSVKSMMNETVIANITVKKK